ncbi:hypothetical protein LMG31886_00170 [Xanthomonas hydrangeae]|nr:hypothetical protein LMG31886_00170 [Xanthomonas hydrangeae]CAD7719496.1 hypothetical protein LMG31886_00170 [Xanthomonas hydrangeae]CAD7730801.1 hypothetical protein LMG31885_15310 [Xanthomonas hydrangeae]CAD7730805.1 hypothetical protein LMG31885_15310 [Xanthomonas hydrangeae]
MAQRNDPGGVRSRHRRCRPMSRLLSSWHGPTRFHPDHRQRGVAAGLRRHRATHARQPAAATRARRQRRVSRTQTQPRSAHQRHGRLDRGGKPPATSSVPRPARLSAALSAGVDLAADAAGHHRRRQPASPGCRRHRADERSGVGRSGAHLPAPGSDQSAVVRRRPGRLSVLALRAVSTRCQRRNAAPPSAVDALPQRGVRARRNRIPVPAAQGPPTHRQPADRSHRVHPHPPRQPPGRRRQVHCDELDFVSIGAGAVRRGIGNRESQRQKSCAVAIPDSPIPIPAPKTTAPAATP